MPCIPHPWIRPCTYLQQHPYLDFAEIILQGIADLKDSESVTRLAIALLASSPGLRGEGEGRSGTHCMRMRRVSSLKIGSRVHRKNFTDLVNGGPALATI